MSTQIRLSGNQKKFAGVLAITFILFFWQVAAWFLPDFLMPDVPTVMVRLWEEIQSADFRAALWGSLVRLASGFGAALVLGVGFGLVGAVLYFFREVLKSAIIILQSIPSIAWVPLFLILMGFGDLPIIVVVALAAKLAHIVWAVLRKERFGAHAAARKIVSCAGGMEGIIGVCRHLALPNERSDERATAPPHASSRARYRRYPCRPRRL